MARRRRAGNQWLLPVTRRGRSIKHFVSCWYCEIKIFLLNDILFSFGSRHASILQVWFALGVAFSFLAFVGVIMVLAWESTYLLNMYTQNVMSSFSNDPLLKHLLLVPSSSKSTVSAGHILLSTITSVIVHELGHAIAAASKSVLIEYVAVFIAILFPGALVSFDEDVLKTSSRCSLLQIYCAGIWHNAVLCAGCWLTIILLPSILWPFYVHGDRPMVLSVVPSSSLTKKLSYGHVIDSVDGFVIHDPREWIERLTNISSTAVIKGEPPDAFVSSLSYISRKGFCVPNSELDQGKKLDSTDRQHACPEGHKPFICLSCLNSSSFYNPDDPSNSSIKTGELHCLYPKDVVDFKECGNGWVIHDSAFKNGSCPQETSCLSPILTPGISWIKISYSTPYNLKCFIRNKRKNCGGSFIIEDDVLSVVRSIELTAYRPRWFFFSNGHFPAIVEKWLTYTFHISASLILLNIAPVFRLDGECILEVVISSLTWLDLRKRKRVLKACLWCGTTLSVLTFSRVLLYNFSLREQ